MARRRTASARFQDDYESAALVSFVWLTCIVTLAVSLLR